MTKMTKMTKTVKQNRKNRKMSTKSPGTFRTPRDLNKTSLMFTTQNTPAALQNALKAFADHKINLTRIESKPCIRSTDYEFHVDFDGDSADESVKDLLSTLRSQTNQLHITQGKKVPWFPRFKRDLDIVANEVLDSGELEADHPGFHDKEYRLRRDKLAQVAKDYRFGDKIPAIHYEQNEIDTWNTVLDKILPLHHKYAAAEHVRLLPLFEQNCGLRKDNIPQLQDISDYLQESTGFSLRPVAGLLSTRNFLYGLAFRTFFSTQYLRHHSRPLYTPEPDLIHEICHSVLFADQAFADFSHQIGLAAIGATDEQIEQLGRCYWFTVEFGLCKQGNDVKAFGAGILSSFGELEYSMGLNPNEKPKLLRFDPFVASKQTYPITTYQPLYFVSDSFETAKEQMIEFAGTLKKPFNVRYLPYTNSIDVDSNIELEKHVFIKPQESPYAKESNKM
jgi:phenylalanine-4-hydroxylase